MTDIMQVMDAAKLIMRQSGNMHQWTDGYPSEAVILSDMEREGGFVVDDGGKLVGYFAFLPSPEPTYSRIYEGDWLDDVRCLATCFWVSHYCTHSTGFVGCARITR